MKLIILLLITYSTSLFSQSDLLCDENGNPILSAITNIGIPNCLTPENIELAVKKNDQSKVCGECLELFQKNADKRVSPLEEKSRKEFFIKLALNEYKKSLTDNLVEALKLRALQPTGSKLSHSIGSCKMKSLNEISKGCSKETKKLINDSGILTDLNKHISNELGKFITEDSSFNPTNTLLKRDNPSCFVSEKDLLLISSRAAEEALSPSIIEKLITLDPSEYSEIGHMFLLNEDITDNYDGDISELTQSLRSHPLLAEHVKDPKSFISFLQSIPSPRTLESLRSTVYSKSSGDIFDKQLAQSCEQSFKSLNVALCSGDFEKGRFNLDAFSNYEKLFQSNIPTNDSALANSEELINKNIEALRYCDKNNGQNKISLFATANTINSNLRQSYRDLSFDSFKEFKYKTELGNLNTFVCSSASRPCTQDTFECKVLQKYNDLKNSGSLESKLARSSNKEVNELLRSMIGDTSNLEPKTKEILIANGIIPRDDGTMVAQPDIPERTTEYFANNNTQNQPVRTTTQIAQTNTNNNQSTRQPFSSNENYTNSQSDTVSPNQESFADFSDILDDSSDELRSIQDEIRRRLADLPEGSRSNREQTKEAVRETFRRHGRQLSPAQTNAIADRLMNPQSTPSPSQFASSTNDDSNRAAVSDTETEIERFRNGQRDAALMGMAGAQQVAARNGDRAPASAEAEKELTTIALNLPQDPEVKLSEVFVNKLNMNDSETQLLKVLMRNKNNFLLQVNSLNFRIQFNDQNSFNLLLENGSREEAERIRPQLEMFLRRLRS